MLARRDRELDSCSEVQLHKQIWKRPFDIGLKPISISRGFQSFGLEGFHELSKEYVSFGPGFLAALPTFSHDRKASPLSGTTGEEGMC